MPRGRNPPFNAICEERISDMSRHRPNAGFTLIEIMVALAILGASLMMLLDTHYSATRLLAEAQDEVLMQTFLQSTLSKAEIDLHAGLESDAGVFGDLYLGYTYSWTAQPYGPVEGLPLMEVIAQVDGPNGTRDISMLVYLNAGPPVEGAGGSQRMPEGQK